MHERSERRTGGKGPAFPGPGHDHGHCVNDALARAERAFEAHGLRLTRLRRVVLAEIVSSHRAIGAYDILERLASHGTRLAPVSVYRAIDALIAAGAIHRLESRNAFFACHNAHEPGAQRIVLSCDTCGCVAEVDAPAAFSDIDRLAAQNNFTARRRIVEIAGTCADCPVAAPAPAKAAR